MKTFVIRVCDFVLYALLAVILIASLIALGTAEGPAKMFVFLGIFGSVLIWCIVSGFWFVFSGMYDELRKLNAIGGIPQNPPATPTPPVLSAPALTL